MQRGVEKFGLLDMKRYIAARDKREYYFVSEGSHDRLHGTAILPFTSDATIVVAASTPIRMPTGLSLIHI